MIRYSYSIVRERKEYNKIVFYFYFKFGYVLEICFIDEGVLLYGFVVFFVIVFFFIGRGFFYLCFNDLDNEIGIFGLSIYIIFSK